ncbi:MAG TPA: hypothetical protein VNQ73_08370 [Ilumatobacter sp.]|nr:hypothetical protein [Ilumatobacter sp.]
MPPASRALAALTARRSPVIRRVAGVAARRWAGPATDIDAVLGFVERQHRQMNEVLALGTNALSVLFQAEVIARSRGSFAAADEATVEHVLARWGTSRIGRLRDFVRFVDSLVSYAALALDAGERPDDREAAA